MTGIIDGLDTFYAPALHRVYSPPGLTLRGPLVLVHDVLAAIDPAVLIAGCRHADWCCTEGCVQPNGVHFVGDWNEVPLDGDQTGSQKWVPCPGECTCEVAMIVHQVVQQLTGGSDD